MANNMRWRYGDTNPVMVPVESATVIEAGDLLYHELSAAHPASKLADQGSQSLNQSTFQSSFLGVAMQASPADSTQSIRVATTGVFEFPCDAAQFDIGDLIGAIEDSSGTALEDQKVVATGSASASIGRCAKQAGAGSVRVLVDIASTIMRGGVVTAS
ncbi:MAG: capsid cement protein [Planctomycetota bacterium]